MHLSAYFLHHLPSSIVEAERAWKDCMVKLSELGRLSTKLRWVITLNTRLRDPSRSRSPPAYWSKSHDYDLQTPIPQQASYRQDAALLFSHHCFTRNICLLM
jgi:hypothetical protein